MKELSLEKTNACNVAKKPYIELMRILACFFVIFNHTNTDGFFLFSVYDPGTIRYWIFLFLSVFCKFSVPIFFAISGALLIPKEESIRIVLKKRVSRMVAVLILITAVYYAYYHLTSFSIRDFLIALYEGTGSLHLWYLYAFIPYLLGLPLLRVFVKNMKNIHFLYMAICVIAFNLLPVFEFLFLNGYCLNDNFRMSWIVSAAVIYPALGYYMENRMDIQKVTGKKLLVLWSINIICIFASCVLTWYRAKTTGVCRESESQMFYNTFVLVNMVTLYISFRYLQFKHPLKGAFAKVLTVIGGCTFNVYLIHILIKDTLDVYRVLNVLKRICPSFVMLPTLLYCCIVFAIGVILTWAFKKIPGLKRLI